MAVGIKAATTFGYGSRELLFYVDDAAVLVNKDLGESSRAGDGPLASGVAGQNLERRKWGGGGVRASKRCCKAWRSFRLAWSWRSLAASPPSWAMEMRSSARAKERGSRKPARLVSDRVQMRDSRSLQVAASSRRGGITLWMLGAEWEQSTANREICAGGIRMAQIENMGASNPNNQLMLCPPARVVHLTWQGRSGRRKGHTAFP